MLKLQIVNNYGGQRLEVYAYTLSTKGREFIFPDEDGRTKYVIIDEGNIPDGENVRPLISLPHHLGLELIEQIAEYAQNEGISVKQQSNNAGKLSAIETHNDFLQTTLTKLVDHLTFRK